MRPVHLAQVIRVSCTDYLIRTGRQPSAIVCFEGRHAMDIARVSTRHSWPIAIASQMRTLLSSEQLAKYARAIGVDEGRHSIDAA